MVARVLVFAGSIRTGAFSGKVADVAQKALAVNGAEVTRISLADYPLPIMDEDLEAEKGVPENAVKLARLIAASDGVMICTPEYNGSLPPLLKNVIDWVSRARGDNNKSLRAWSGKVIGICASSNGHWGGIRSAAHLRQVLSHIQAEVIAAQCLVPNAGEAFDEDGEFREERMRNSIQGVCKSLTQRAWQLSARETN